LKLLEINKKSSDKFEMDSKNVSIHDAEYWKRTPLSLADAVFAIIPRTEEVHKSEFSDFFIDLSCRVPSSSARTLTGQRVEMSVLECDPEILNEFADHLAWLRTKNMDPINYQIGYTRDFNHGKPQLKYVQLKYGQKIEEKVF
jgi:hypothetical protein